MDIRIPIVIVILFASYLLGNSYRGRKQYIILISTVLIFESCLRSMFIGPDDTYNYYNMFKSYTDISKLNILELFKDGYVNMQMYAKDPGFIVLIYIFHIISDNYQLFLFFAAIIFFVPLGVVINRYAKSMQDVKFAYILHMALFHVIAMCCLRQQIASGIAFIIFLSVVDKKYVRAIIMFIIGFTIHKSMILIILPIFVVFIFANNVKKIHLFSFFIAPIFFFLSHKIVGIMAEATQNDYYMDYANSEGSGYTFLVLAELCSLICYIAISAKDLYNTSFPYRYIYSMLPFITIFVPLITVDGAMIRISQYFTLYLLILLPIAIKSLKKNGTTSFRMTCAMSILIILMFMHPYEYYFFWEYVPNPY